MKLKHTRLCLAAIGPLLLAACSGAPQPASGSPAASAQPNAVPSASAAASAAPSGSSGVDALVQQARQEGHLQLVWGQGSFGTSMDPFIAGFNQYYGLNLQVQFTPGPQMRDQAAQTVQEVQAGQTPSTDLSLGYGDTLAVLSAGQADQPTDWTWAPNIQNPQLQAPNGIGVIVQDGVDGITYNTNDVEPDAVPHTMQDLLNPALRGRIASTSYAAGFDYLASDDMWGEQKAFDYLTQFSQQVSGLLRCSDMDRIGSGEFDVFALDCSQGNTLQDQAMGMPLGFVVPTDAAFTTELYLSPVRNAAHPAAAKLFINYMLSRQAQDLLYQNSYADTALVADSRTAALLDQVKSAGGTVTSINYQWVQAQGDKEPARLQRAVQILSQSPGVHQ